MERRESVLEALKKRRAALRHLDEVWKSDHEVVLTAVQQDWRALQFAAEALKGNREIVLAAVQGSGFALGYATEALRADREVVLIAVQEDGYALEYAMEALKSDRDVVLAAVQQDEDALRCAADALVEDPAFATEAKSSRYLLKLTLMSGRSTVVAAEWHWSVEDVLFVCRKKLGLVDDGATMEVWHDSGERVPDDDVRVEDFPGVQPKGEISEYQLLVRR